MGFQHEGANVTFIPECKYAKFYQRKETRRGFFVMSVRENPKDKRPGWGWGVSNLHLLQSIQMTFIYKKISTKGVRSSPLNPSANAMYIFHGDMTTYKTRSSSAHLLIVHDIRRSFLLSVFICIFTYCVDRVNDLRTIK